MIKIITYYICLVCMITSSLYCMKPEKKDVLTLDDLKTEISRIRKQHNQNKPMLPHSIITKGNRINHEPTHKQSTNQTDNHT